MIQAVTAFRSLAQNRLQDYDVVQSHFRPKARAGKELRSRNMCLGIDVQGMAFELITGLVKSGPETA